MILQNKTVMQMFFESERRSLIFLSLLWIGAVIFVNPIGEFPLNDDSIYAHWPKSIVENTSSQINGLLAPNLMLQAAWGALICQLTGGFSLTALRFSTLLLGWLNIFIVFGWAKAVSKGKISALLITAALVFNPVYFSLCHTFMTDVPFLVISNVALWLYFIYFQKRLEPYRWGAILIASLAFGIRQPAILLIFFFEIGIFLSSPKKMKSWIQLVFGVVWCVGLYVGVATVIKPYFGIQNAYLPVAAGFFDLLTNETGLFIFQLSKRTLMTIFHFGLFALPFMIPFFKHIKPEKWLQWHFFGPILLFNIAVILTLMQIDYYFPYSRAIFFNWGLGTYFLTDIFPLKVNLPAHLPYPVIMIFGLVCQIYGCYLMIFVLQRIWKLLTQPYKNSFLLTLIVFNFFYLGAMLIYNFFDRYLLLPFLTLLFILIPVLTTEIKKNKRYVTITLSIFTAFGIAGTHEYLDWNRAAKTACEDLKSQGIPFEDIDGGGAFNQFYKENPYDAREPYMITLGALPNYVKVDSVYFCKPLFLRKGKLYILKRNQDEKFQK